MEDQSAKVLVAEDSATVRGLVGRIFTKAGFEVIEVADGLDALTAVLVDRPDVAVLDHHMPGCTGGEVLRRIRSRPDCDDVAVVLLTGADDRSAAAEALSAGADDFIRKPCEPNELVARVRKVLATRRRVADADRRSSTDPLTGLPNRRGMQPVLETLAGPQGSATALFVVDVDHFKSVNDTYGHDVGDAVLRTVAGRLAASWSQLTVSRWGGEEFVAAGRCDGPADLRRLGEGLRRSVCAVGCEVDDASGALVSIPVTVSVGGVLVPRGVALDDVLADADAALYAAKEGGRDRVVVVTDDGLEEVVTARAPRRVESLDDHPDVRAMSPQRVDREHALDDLEAFVRD